MFSKTRSHHSPALPIRSGLTLLTLIGLLGLAPASVLAQGPGELDPTFGPASDGKVTTDVAGWIDKLNDVVVQESDGKIVTAGYTSLELSVFAVARYNTDGSLDTNFGGNPIPGVAMGGTLGGPEQANAIAIESEGSYLAAGFVVNADTTDDFALVRFDPNGNVIGGATHDFWGYNAQANDMLIQSDGKIVLAGYTDYYGNDDFALVRYNMDLSLDMTYGTAANGTVIQSFFGTDRIHAAALGPLDSIVVAGYINDGINDHLAVARFDSNGNLDTSFGSGGLAEVAFSSYGGTDSRANAIALLDGGAILVAGFANDNTSDKPVMVRFDSSGNLDTSFSSGDGSDGVLLPGNWQTPSPDAWFSDLAVQTDGKILGVNGPAFVAARFESNGTFDPSYATTPTDFFGTGGENVANAVALQTNGRVVLAGFANQGTGAPEDFAVARFVGTPEVDETPPDTVIVSGPSDPDNDPSPTFEFTGDDGSGSGIASFDCQIDEGGWMTGCVSPYTAETLADGSHIFEVRAIDNVELTDTTPASHTWTIDTVPPSGPILLGPEDSAIFTSTNVVTLTWQHVVSGDVAAGFTLNLGGETVDVGEVAEYAAGPLANGPYNWTVAAYDAAGNSSDYPAARSFEVDVAQEQFVINPGASETTVISTAGGVVIQIPAGTLPTEAASLGYSDLGITPTTAIVLGLPSPTDFGAALDMVLLDGSGETITGTVFAPPLTITVGYDQAAIDAAGINESLLTPYFFNETTAMWEALEVVGRDTTANTVTFLVSHLTEFGLVEMKQAGLSVTKEVDTGGLDEVPLGGVVTYTVVFSNSGNTVASNVMITDPLPAGVSFGAWVTYGGSTVLPPPSTANLPPFTVTWSPGDVAAGDEYQFSFTAVVTDTASFAGEEIVNAAYASADNAPSAFGSASFTIEGGDSFIFLPRVMRMF